MKKIASLLSLLCIVMTAYAQQKIKGEVKDEMGEPLIGASVIVKSSAQSGGTITDINGNFSIDAKSNATLTISYVGFITQDVNINGRSNLSIVLKENSTNLNEVVVIGYGTQRKGDITSSVASVRPSDFNKGAVKDVGQLIQGKVAGLAITNYTGDPTGGTQIRLRGTNTIGGANTEPLVLIDGIPGTLETVAPEDVESVDILKDGSAAAIYGTRGTNGVILITTKQAKGRNYSKVDYSGYISTQQIAKKLDMLSADEFRELYPDQDHGHNTDWIDEITRTPISHVHNLSLQGGTNNTSYIANVNYSDRQGIMLHSDFQSFQGRIEVTQRMFNDKLTLKFGLLGKQNNHTSTSAGGSFRSTAYMQATTYNPTDPIYNEDGTYYQNLSKFAYENPVSLLNECDGNVKRTNVRFNGNVIFRPIEELTFSMMLSYNRSARNYFYGETMQHISAIRDGFKGWSSASADTNTEKLLELTAQYSKRFGDHNLTALAGYTYNEHSDDGERIENYGFQDGYFGGAYNIGIGQAAKDGKAGLNSWRSDTNLIGFFGRLSYSFKDRYLAMVALRYEGASQLYGTDNAWGLFPSFSLGWRITNEAFMKDQKIFDDLKIRAGYGITGSQPKNSFLGVAMLKYDQYAYSNGQWVQTIVPASNPNPDLRWEEKKEFNVGIDWSSLNGRLSGTIDYYDRKVDGLIYDYTVPTPPNLVNTTTANGGTMRNRGIEILISSIPVQTKDWYWSSSVTWSLNSNKLESLNGSIFKTDYDYFDTGSLMYGGEQFTSSHRVQVGEPIGNIYGFKVVDVDNEGYWIYEDRNGNLVNYKDFKHAPEDKHVIGNGLPKWYLGWNNNISYKNFDLSISMRGAFGFQIINEARINYEDTKNGRAINRLSTVNRDIFGKVPLNKNVEEEFNSFYVEDGDYWKIDNVTLGYTLPEFTKWISKLRIYASVNNLCTFTGYEGVDPEVSTNGLNPGVDYRSSYPNIRSFTFGLNVSF